ncbi:MAG: segregation/condensation protein A [Methanosarcinales archaeon]|nr:segregation/condensation protein A [Methanosarcinales archaeon]
MPPIYTPMSDIPDDPIEILVRLAKDNEIDPWNINIIEVADKFLEQLESHRSDIRYFGRTLHYAAILLRMKADAIIDEKEGEEEEKEELDHFDIEEYPIPEPQIRRRSKRPVTLDELISELKKAEKVEIRRVARSKEKGVGREKSVMTVDDILSVAHEERIEENIRELGMILNEKFKQKDVITLDELLDHDTDKIITYISLLFMATRKEIWLEQPELFGELYITRGEPDV